MGGRGGGGRGEGGGRGGRGILRVSMTRGQGQGIEFSSPPMGAGLAKIYM